VLQFQSFMYSKAFAQMLAGTSDGNPSIIARPITWDAALVGRHLALLNTVFATIQLLIGLGIAFRPTLRPALAASVAWALGVWWFGEGLGGVLSPRSIMPHWIQRIAPVSPGYWGLSEYHRILTSHLGLVGALPGVAILAALSCVLGAAAAVSFRAAAPRLGWG